MDAKLSSREEKLKNLLRQAASLAAEIQADSQQGRVPHFDEIELPAHALGQEFSRMVQTVRARGVAADGLQEVTCPGCGTRCPVETQSRQVHSMDGPIEVTETVANCRRCRRSFFPSACELGIG